MNTDNHPVRRSMHPLVIAAAIAIIALSAVGISVLLYNRSEAQTANPPMVASADTSNAAPGFANTVPPPPAGFDNTAPLPGASAAGAPASAPAPGLNTNAGSARGSVAVDGSGAPLGANAVPPGAPLPPPPAMAQAAAVPCGSCATVVDERPITVQGRGTGLGAVGGGVAGGLIGNTIGRGHGNIAMTLLGAAGGALAGNAIEEHANSRTEYRMTVRFPDGHERSFTHLHPWGYQVGQTVRVEHGRILALN